jgi:hypothetical protein
MFHMTPSTMYIRRVSKRAESMHPHTIYRDKEREFLLNFGTYFANVEVLGVMT